MAMADADDGARVTGFVAGPVMGMVGDQHQALGRHSVRQLAQPGFDGIELADRRYKDPQGLARWSCFRQGKLATGVVAAQIAQAFELPEKCPFDP